MGLRRANKYEVCCDFCEETTDWATAGTRNAAAILLIQHEWFVEDKKWKCKYCKEKELDAEDKEVAQK